MTSACTPALTGVHRKSGPIQLRRPDHGIEVPTALRRRMRSRPQTRKAEGPCGSRGRSGRGKVDEFLAALASTGPWRAAPMNVASSGASRRETFQPPFGGSSRVPPSSSKRPRTYARSVQGTTAFCDQLGAMRCTPSHFGRWFPTVVGLFDSLADLPGYHLHGASEFELIETASHEEWVCPPASRHHKLYRRRGSPSCFSKALKKSSMPPDMPSSNSGAQGIGPGVVSNTCGSSVTRRIRRGMHTDGETQSQAAKKKREKDHTSQPESIAERCALTRPSGYVWKNTQRSDVYHNVRDDIEDARTNFVICLAQRAH